MKTMAQMKAGPVMPASGERGAPGDLPFELPTRYELVVNLKAAKAMDLAETPRVNHAARRRGCRVALCGAINVNWLTHARACVLFS